jgi:hypothetical protein
MAPSAPVCAFSQGHSGQVKTINPEYGHRIICSQTHKSGPASLLL